MSDNPKIHFDLPTGVQATDLAQVFTSKPYPVIFKDAMTSRSTLVGVRLNQGTVDAMAVSTTLTGFTLREALRSVSEAPEAMAPTTTLTGLTLTPFTFLEETIDPDAMVPTTTLTGLTLTPASKVTYTVPSEAFEPTTTLTGFTLS